MTTSPARHPRTDRSSREPQPSEPYGAATFAAMLMLLVGTLHLVEGLVALVNEDFYVLRAAEPFQLDLVAWGWIHVVFGVAVALAGGGLLGGVRGARAAATVLATLSVLVNAAWLPYYPLWSATVVGLDIFVLWSLLGTARTGRPPTHDRRAR
jgi:hypothetical protein